MKRRSFLQFFGLAAAAPVVAKAAEVIPAVTEAAAPVADHLGTSVASTWPRGQVFAGGIYSMASCTVIEAVSFRSLDGRSVDYDE